MKDDVIIRQFKDNDFAAVREIYQQGIDTGHATFETRAKTQQQWMSATLEHCRLVAVISQQVVGWAALSAVSARSVYRGVAELSVYVANGHSGRGIGNSLLGNLVQCAESNQMWMLQASVFPENHASIALHLRHGFRRVGVRQHIAQQHGKWRDTVLLERRSAVVGVG